MSNQEGFWWSVGRFCYKCFSGLEWTYEHMTPNKWIIAFGFIATAAWIYVQHKYNKKAITEGGYK